MFTPRELEGEVDHSFFDSDGDGGGDVAEKTIKKGSKLEGQMPSKHKTERGKQVESNKRGNTNNVSLDFFPPNELLQEGKGELNLPPKRSSGAFLALLTNMSKEADNTGQNEIAGSTEVNEQSPGRITKNQRPKIPPPPPNEASTDADSESSCSSQRRSVNLSKATKSSVRRKTRRSRRSSAGSQDVPNMSTDESDGSVTDVSPLSSPGSSSLQSLSSEAEERESHLVQREQESVPSSGFSSIYQEEDSNPDVDESSFRLDSHLEHKLVLQSPGGMYRKNYSFSKDEVRRIDHENQRLLRELSRFSPGAGSWKMAKTNVSNKPSTSHLAHSTLNRQREQRRIEQENLAFLKRLQSIKATPGLRRSEQLADHQRLGGYPSFRRPSSGSSRTSSALTGPRPTSSRAALTDTDSTSTPVPRPSKGTTNGPSWC